MKRSRRNAVSQERNEPFDKISTPDWDGTTVFLSSKMDGAREMSGNGRGDFLSAGREASESNMPEMPCTEAMPAFGSRDPVRGFRWFDGSGEVSADRQTGQHRNTAQPIPSDVLSGLFADATAGLIAYGGAPGFELALKLKANYYEWLAYCGH